MAREGRKIKVKKKKKTRRKNEWRMMMMMIDCMVEAGKTGDKTAKPFFSN